MADQKILSEGREGSFRYFQGPYIDINIDSTQLTDSDIQVATDLETKICSNYAS